jgi:hypothetical protein
MHAPSTTPIHNSSNTHFHGAATQAHALTTLAALAAHSPAACQQLLEAPSAVTCLGSLARHPSSSALRLQAAAAVAALVEAAHGGALEVAPGLLQVRVRAGVSMASARQPQGCASSLYVHVVAHAWGASQQVEWQLCKGLYLANTWFQACAAPDTVNLVLVTARVIAEEVRPVCVLALPVNRRCRGSAGGCSPVS